ncbi:serine hydrolase [Clostridium boliviensis]|uniref:Serine hydrolase n=1 Tax=Clostridium boliviensis TaxID=318465 RepID=A0ABU4GKX5_9CLOT|nr:serine hydrolase [Clostridium boliviensis]MDW2798259.1 serine hydrolase [Clostridium boliviensis]
MTQEVINTKLDQLPGKISFICENLQTGEYMGYREDRPLMAASVIKLFVMAFAFHQFETGGLRQDFSLTIYKKDCVPSCGALTYLHEGISVTALDLVTLMIIFSDNTATNVLIDLLGMEKINQYIDSLGFERTFLNRKMFDVEKSRQGIQNYITASETGRLLKMMHRGELVSKAASRQMISILKNQQLRSKIPFYLQALEEKPEIAHKTGEDRGITHDVGIVYGNVPLLLCFCGNETDTPAFERIMGELSLQLYSEVNGSGL